jgi:hypothetical protein
MSGWYTWAMKSIGIALVASIILFGRPTSALADEASKNAKIEEMMQLTHADQMVQQMFDRMKSIQLAQLNKTEMSDEQREAAAEIQQKVMALVSERISWDKMKPAYMKIYGEMFTEEELGSIVEFYKSPAGKALLEKMPTLVQRSMTVGQQLMGDVAPEIKRITDEVKEKYKKQGK